MHEHVLAGCRPVPLASYLKALAVLRLVCEQADSEARGCWKDDTFVLRTVLDRDALLRFFLHDYAPTPIIAPWNGGSGFYPKDNKDAIREITASPAPRFAGYRAAIESATQILTELEITEKVSTSDKPRLLESCRARLPDDVLPWLDAALFIGTDGPKYPPLLGTGGNDGRLDFTNNFMQRLLDVVDPKSGEPKPSGQELLAAALFDEPTDGLTGGAIGQFLPSGAGGANLSSGFEGSSRFDPWDFVLMIEGAVTFAVAAVRRMEHDARGTFSYPFTVRPTGAGYASGTDADEGASRGEIWMPLWGRPAGAAEVRTLLSEGRARVGGRTARHGVDFARAVATLGVDRGITELQRYGMLVRNGLSYLATPLDRFRVRNEPSARLLDPIDGWLDRFRRAATRDRAPAAARRALGVLEEAIIDLCRRGGPDRVQDVLVALGLCERTMARSLRWAVDSKLDPVPGLSPDWLAQADDGSVELRLAVALGSVDARAASRRLPIRCHLEPVSTRAVRGAVRAEWDTSSTRDVVWNDGDLVRAMNAAFARRLVLFEQSGAGSYPDSARTPAALSDVAAFVEGRTDDARLSRLLWATILLDPARLEPGAVRRLPGDRVLPPALYATLKLCFAGARGDCAVPMVPRIHRLAASGDGAGASRVAAQRLRASGRAPAVGVIAQRGDLARRSAAALLFPLDSRDLTAIERTVLRPENLSGEATS